VEIEGQTNSATIRKSCESGTIDIREFVSSIKNTMASINGIFMITHDPVSNIHSFKTTILWYTSTM
jgi:uncharacterized protein YaaN involved in tellurite resistance